MSVFIIAEAGVNHNGSLEMACQLIDIAAEAQADAVKFQTFKASDLVSRYAPKAEYQKRTTARAESQLEMIQKLELSNADHHTLRAYATQKSISFLSTPFDAQSLDFLVNELALSTIKLSSGEITNVPFLVQVARSGCRIILSTGMSTLEEVALALSALAFGFCNATKRNPADGDFKTAFTSPKGQKALQDNVTLLHCTTEYPAATNEVNLRAMDTLATTFGLRVGYSDHTAGIHIAIAAAARGAAVIEKHFTLSRQLQGPDHAASLEPQELSQLVSAVRDVACALGDGIKRPSQTETKNRLVARKSLIATRAIKQGEIFTVDNLASKRPGTGISPAKYWDYLGVTALQDYAPDELIDQ